MNDRELLELAAKAARIELKWSADVDVPPRMQPSWESWSPLTDDGDALRLAVKLNIEIAAHGSLGINGEIPASVCYYDHGGVYGNSVMGIGEPSGTDRYAATRRAIVRAAAEIGKVQK